MWIILVSDLVTRGVIPVSLGQPEPIKLLPRAPEPTSGKDLELGIIYIALYFLRIAIH